jgi:aldose 1-epimerase
MKRSTTLSVDAELSSPGLSVGIVGYGARLAYIRTPDRHGVFGEVSMGFDDPAAWRSDPSYQGASIGRYANRIAGGTFEVNGRSFTVPLNEANTALHGGPAGFSSQIWEVEPVVRTAHEMSVTLRRTSPDGEMGFPGNLDVSVVFSVSSTELTLDYRAVTDAPTPVNLTNHVYLNLSGSPSSIADHELTVFADRIAAVDTDFIPTGELLDLTGTPMDYRTSTVIGSRWRADHPQMVLVRGHDHAYLLDGSGGEYDGLRLAAVALERVSGRRLELFTDQPSVQFYSGNSLDGSVVTRAGATLRQGDAFCLEPQHLPNSVNQPNFPDTVLLPGQEYRNRSVYRFTAQ